MSLVLPDPIERPLERAGRTFLLTTYAYLGAAIALLVAIEVALFRSGAITELVRSLHSVPWPLVFGIFLLLSWFARRVARRTARPALQLAALGSFVALHAVVFAPLLHRAESRAPGTIESAAWTATIGTVALTVVAWTSRRRFAGLAMFVSWGLFVALLLMVMSWFFGWRLGTWFAVAMVALSGGAILTDTARILRQRRSGYEIASALELFASVAMLFWWLLRLANRR